MIDKILKINNNELMLIFDDRAPVSIYSSEGKAYEVLLWLLSPSKLNLQDHTRALATQGEETCDIILKAA